MKQFVLPVAAFGMIAAAYLSACTNPVSQVEAAPPEMSAEEYVLQGKYLTDMSGCHDCHTPKVFPNGIMRLDESRLLSGHPNGSPLPPVDLKALEPGYWALFSGDLTVAVGPWGMTYARNLTPHETGIKGWTLEVFIKAMRSGKHMGVEQGRPIMPPMPWENLSKASDEDLKAIYMYLQSLPPVDNQVPDPVSPDDVRTMASVQGS